MNRIMWSIALAMTCAFAGRAQAGAYENVAKPYLQQLCVKSVAGNVPRGCNPDSHFITIDPSDWYDAEQAAVSGYSWYSGSTRTPVGGAFRGHSVGPTGAVFGIAVESITGENAPAHVIGAEVVVVSRNPNSANAVKWGLPLIFKNRTDGLPAAEAGLGDNSYNEGSVGIPVQSFARSSVGEFSGWQSVIRVDANAIDRTKRIPYATVLNMESTGTAPGVAWYVATWACGSSKCGLAINGEQLEVWTAIDSPFPRRLRVL